jgi:7-carboxy-7-deazaguanine synthase
LGLTTDDRLLITEIFASIQGEGARVGIPTAFVRLARCPYRCTWCDSAYTFTGGTPMTTGEVAERIRGLGRLPNVCITGGEPLVQRKAVRELAEELLAQEPRLESVEIETSGGLEIWPAEDARLHWDLDVKCPGSAMEAHFNAANLDRLRRGDEIKFVLVDRRDFVYAAEFVRQRLVDSPAAVFFQPAWGHLEPAQLVAWMDEEGLPGVRLSLQLHKYIWGAETRGV